MRRKGNEKKNNSSHDDKPKFNTFNSKRFLSNQFLFTILILCLLLNMDMPCIYRTHQFLRKSLNNNRFQHQFLTLSYAASIIHLYLFKRKPFTLMKDLNE